MNYLENTINQIIEEQNIPFEWNSLVDQELENINLNGVTDLTVSIIGKNVLDLKGSLKIKQSSGFLVPLTDTEFEAKHTMRSLDEKKWIR